MNINPLFPVEIWKKAECLYWWAALIKQLISTVTDAHAHIANKMQFQAECSDRKRVNEMMENE